MRIETSREVTWDCRCQGCRNADKEQEADRRIAFQGYSHTNSIDTSELSDYEYLLLPDRLAVFVFGTRTWGKNIRSTKTSASPDIPTDNTAELAYTKNLSAPRF